MQAPVTLTPDAWAQLVQVNRDVNAFPYETDMARYGKADFWTLIDAQGGDCEDYALEKRRRLLAMGWALAAVRLAVCVDETGAGHAVLTIDAVHPQSGPGTWVLDNRFVDIEAYDALPYRWIERQAPGLPGWVAIAPAP